jgi:hypothetical protein
MKEGEFGGACSTYGRRRKPYKGSCQGNKKTPFEKFGSRREYKITKKKC